MNRTIDEIQADVDAAGQGVVDARQTAKERWAASEADPRDRQAGVNANSAVSRMDTVTENLKDLLLEQYFAQREVTA